MARILVINDTQQILDLFRAILEDEHHEVLLSGTPILKASEVEQIHPDLIILDVVFGDQQSGWQMLQMLRMQPATTCLPIILCTAALREVQEQEGYLITQGVRVLYKPFDIDDLLSVTALALAEHQKPISGKDPGRR
ncbi:MAG TPA: response regulator [Ktedonobacteraceae bacterium]|jgi:DNA-binding response OmpR family regulator